MKYGVVALTPCTWKSSLWKQCGAVVATTKTIDEEMDNSKNENARIP